MPTHNSDVAEAFEKIADLLEIGGKNRFRVRAYRDAARTIEGLSRSVADMIEDGEDLSELPGIGKDLAGKIETLVKKGSLPQLEKLEKEYPEALSRMMEIRGLGAKRVKAIYEELEVKSVDDLRTAAEEGRIRELDGFGKKTEAKILEEIERLGSGGGRTPVFKAAKVAGSLVDHLETLGGVKKLTVAGSFRRGRETVGDLDILIVTKRGVDPMDHFSGYEDIADVLSRGKSKSSVLLDSGLQVDLRSVAAVSYGAALLYFTGSKAHNISLRKIARKKGWKINEYGLFDGDERIAGKTEKEIYGKLGLDYIEPELREDRGEIDAAADGSLPDLVSRRDIRGDLHVHTDRTDGHYTIGEMARAAMERDLEYIAITEHSKSVRVAGGLDEDELAGHVDKIEEENEKTDGIEIMSGVEVDILEDGSLDLSDDILSRLDVVVCSIHSAFDLPKKKQTSRILRAMDNEYFQILGHPGGRMIGQRPPLDFDLDRVLKAAGERGCVMELNSRPERLDLDDASCKSAREAGVPVVISTDAHRKDDFDFLDYGVRQARRGWLEPSDVLNTRPFSKVRKLLRG